MKVRTWIPIVTLLTGSVLPSCNCGEPDILTEVRCTPCDMPPAPLCVDHNTLVRWEYKGQCNDRDPNLCRYEPAPTECEFGCDRNTIMCIANPPDAGFNDAVDGGFNPPQDGGTRFIDGGVIVGDGGVNPPGDGGVNPPQDGGFNPPGDGGFNDPADGGFNSPVDGGFYPPRDGGVSPPRDGGFNPPQDGGFNPPRDGGVNPPGDGGFNDPVDGGFNPAADGGFNPPTDGGVNPPRDGGVMPIDGGVMPIDGGIVPIDGGVATVDGGISLPCTPANDLSRNVVAIVEEPMAQVTPTIAYNGSEYLVAWQDNRNPGLSEIYIARLRSDLTKIGNDIRVSNDPQSSIKPFVAWAGTTWVVVWTTTIPNTGPGDAINFVTVSTAGVVGTPTIITNAAARGADDAIAVFDGTNVGVVWTDSRGTTQSNADLFFRYLTINGNPLIPENRLFTITSPPQRFRPWMTWDAANSRFDLSWQEGSGSTQTIQFGGINTNGAFVNLSRTIASGMGSAVVGVPAHSLMASGYGMTWLFGTPPNYETAFGVLDRSGTVQTSSVLTMGQMQSGNRMSVAGTPFGAGIFWQARGANTSDEIHFVEVTTSAAPTSQIRQVSTTAASSSNPHAIRVNGEYVAVWHDSFPTTGMGDDIHITRGVCIQ